MNRPDDDDDEEEMADNFIEFAFASNAHVRKKTRKFVKNKYGMYATCDHIDVAHCKFLMPVSDSPLATELDPRQAPLRSFVMVRGKIRQLLPVK